MTDDQNDFERSEYRAAFVRDGYAVFPRALEPDVIKETAAALEQISLTSAVRRKTSVYGIRNLLETCDAICRLATHSDVWRFVTAILGEEAFATRAILFSKTPDANWALGWHQDSVISVAERIETPGFTAWGRKAGVWQVQPPAEILAGMLALRIHLDDCGPENGPLRVIPGSHRNGWLDDELDDWKRRVPPVVCSVPSGGIVAMCPLTLHASSRAADPSQRRVVHIEYANRLLPNGLQWNRQIAPIVNGSARRSIEPPITRMDTDQGDSSISSVISVPSVVTIPPLTPDTKRGDLHDGPSDSRRVEREDHRLCHDGVEHPQAGVG